MKHRRLAPLLATCLVLAGALAVSPGCASSSDAKQTVDSMGDFGLEVAKVKDSIDNATRSLETVAGSQPGEINANVQAYSKAVAALDKQAKVVRGRAEEMRSKGDEFFKEWEPENVSADRRVQLTASYAKIKQDMTVAKDEFTPFLAALKDVEGYLKVDPSVKGVDSVGALVDKAKDIGARVKSRIDAVLSQVNSVRGMVSTK